MTDPDPETRIVALSLEAYQEQGESALESAIQQHPELEDRIRQAAAAMRELLDAAQTGGVTQSDSQWTGRNRLGRFQLGAKLGQGGMGAVYEAYDPELKRRVAIKVFPTPASHSAAALERFRREGEALAKMRHPHIVPVLEIGETDDGQPYIVMPFVEGASLTTLLSALSATHPELPESWRRIEQDGYWKTVAHKLADVADAVEHAHARGLVHRDIKPGNIIIDESGEAILIDFGVVRVTHDEAMTLSGTLLGTPAFMAPEQVKDPDRVGPTTDVYGLGATLYQCLTWRLPFDAHSQEEFYDKICRREPVAPRRVRHSVPRDLETICAVAMEKDQARRYPTAAEFRDDLRSFVESRPIQARPLGAAMRLTRWVRRDPATATALFLAFFLFFIAPTLLSIYMSSVATEERVVKEQVMSESRQKERAQAMAAYSAGQLLAQRGRWTQALKQYDAAIRRHPDPTLVAIGRIEAHEGNMDVPAAMQELERLHRGSIPDQHEAKLYLLEADLGVNRLADPDAKLDLVDRALALKTLGPADALLARAMQAKTVAKALRLLRRARRIDPTHRRINDCYSVLLMAGGHADELAQFSKELRAIYPDDPTAHVMETFVRGLRGERPATEQDASQPARAFNEDQLVMLGFVKKAARFIRAYDEITRTQLLDASLHRTTPTKSAILKDALALALEATRLLKTQRTSASGKQTWFRVLPIVARTLSDLIKSVIGVLASSMFTKPDPTKVIAQLDRASRDLGDAVYAQGSGMWHLLGDDYIEAEKRFALAATSPSLILTQRTARLYLIHTRYELYLRADRRGASEAAQHRQGALETIRRTLETGPLSADECRFLFDRAWTLEDHEVALALALRWRKVASDGDRYPTTAMGAAMKRLLEAPEASQRDDPGAHK